MTRLLGRIAEYDGGDVRGVGLERWNVSVGCRWVLGAGGYVNASIWYKESMEWGVGKRDTRV